jgi:hypothetical protein
MSTHIGPLNFELLAFPGIDLVRNVWGMWEYLLLQGFAPVVVKSSWTLHTDNYRRTRTRFVVVGKRLLAGLQLVQSRVEGAAQVVEC